MVDKKKIKVVILCGGMGLRFKGYIDGTPKPLIHVGERPILWHIMKYYAYYGFNNFILCLGHMGNEIRNYFSSGMPWNIVFADTGLNTNTGGRIKRIEKYIKEKMLLVTYGDGLSDMDLNKLIEFHQKKKRIATITCVKPHSPFGMVNIENDGIVSSFDEKPVLNQWINGGFFVFDRKIFKYLNDNEVLEKEAFERLVDKKELAAYRFMGFWRCMDTYKDHLILNELWDHGNPLWAKWLKKG